MPRPARVTTRTGDSGETSLFGKGRVRKTDPRIVALGDLDEAQSALGVARASVPAAERSLLLDLQRGLYRVMAEVATPTADVPRLRERIDADAVSSIDALVDGLRERAGAEGRFVVPGEDVASATLDVARTVVRRAERSVVGLADAKLLDGEHLVPWLNRLSDVVFLLARVVEPARTAASTAKRGRAER
ncbi:MAG: cob(I)yrinic acid a,c-diamide adenosyltransferase [Chloroflexota bacterium]|nr:cob(I)yrinic acid a,c-diamide adenosyltransferase [Chloroflexota bacterium]